jgi:hypothetical protein
LLQKHRHDGDQHAGQRAGFLWVKLLQSKGCAASTLAAWLARPVRSAPAVVPSGDIGQRQGHA